VARVRSFGRSHQRIKAHPTEVDCEYATVGEGVDRLLHLSSFGSDGRASDHKSSQSLQLDAVRAQALVDIIEDSFPGIRRR
jgi:hypothetical protein